MKSDASLRITYPVNQPEETEIATNAKPEALEEIISS